MKWIAELLIGCMMLTTGCTQMKPVEVGTATTVEFRLGERSFEENGTKIPFPLDGIISVPEGEKKPVVFVLHGAHPIEDVTQDRYYNGFSYLTEYLAQRGFVAISINVNRAYSFEPVEGNENDRAYRLFEQYRALLEQANAGERVFEADLTGKVDLTRINFIGHSRGGDNSMFIAKQLGEAGRPVRSVSLLASPLGSGYESVYTDVPTAMILPQFDGDVVGLDSNAIFEHAYANSSTRKTPAVSAFLYGGDHSRFSTALPEGDTLAPPKGAVYIDGAVQRAFVSQYTAEFLNAVNKPTADTDLTKLLGNTAPKRYGINFMPSVFTPNQKTVITPAAGAPNTQTQGMKLDFVQSSQLFSEDTAAPLRLPSGYAQKVPLYRLAWTKSGQSITFSVKDQDWSSFQTLSLRIMNASLLQGLENGQSLALDVILTDKSGAQRVYNLRADQNTALRLIPTQIVNLFEGMEDLPAYYQAEYMTPLGTESLELDGKLKNVDKITLRAASDTGAVMLAGMTVQ